MGWGGDGVVGGEGGGEGFGGEMTVGAAVGVSWAWKVGGEDCAASENRSKSVMCGEESGKRETNDLGEYFFIPPARP